MFPAMTAFRPASLPLPQEPPARLQGTRYTVPSVTFRGTTPSVAEHIAEQLTKGSLEDVITISYRSHLPFKKPVAVAKFYRMPGYFVIKGLDENAVRINQKPLKKGEFKRLQVGDQISVKGQTTFNMPAVRLLGDPSFGLQPLSGEVAEQVVKYQESYQIGPDEKILDGFRSPADVESILDRQGMPVFHRQCEILTVDRQNDPALAAMCEWARGLRKLPDAERFKAVVFKVHKTLDYDEMSNPAPPRKALPLGYFIQAGKGACRHQALLLKVLADEADIPFALCNGGLFDPAKKTWRAHTWNLIPNNTLLDLANGSSLKPGAEGWARYKLGWTSDQ